MKFSRVPFALERFSVKVQRLPPELHILPHAILDSKLNWLHVREELINKTLKYKKDITLKWQDPNVMDENEAVI